MMHWILSLTTVTKPLVPIFSSCLSEDDNRFSVSSSLALFLLSPWTKLCLSPPTNSLGGRHCDPGTNICGPFSTCTFHRIHQSKIFSMLRPEGIPIIVLQPLVKVEAFSSLAGAFIRSSLILQSLDHLPCSDRRRSLLHAAWVKGFHILSSPPFLRNHSSS